jgi:hypothetical protein
MVTTTWHAALPQPAIGDPPRAADLGDAILGLGPALSAQVDAVADRLRVA